MPETRSTQAAGAALPHLTCRLTPSDQAIIAARTPLRFHTYTPTLTDPSAAAPAAAHPILEPFLPLSSPTPSTLPLILTPPRPSDAAALVQTLNDPLVALQLQGPPYPYSDALAGEYVALKISETVRLLERLGERARRALRPSAEADIAGEGSVRGGKDRDTDEDGEPWLDELPLCAVRRADTGEYVGDFGVHRWRFEDVPEGQERERAIKENEAKVAGDSSVLWSFGYYLRPEYHGQGLMTHVLRTVLDTYLFGYLGADEVRGSAFADNLASIRTQEKCGLRRYGKGEYEVCESRGGGVRETTMLKVRREDFVRA